MNPPTPPSAPRFNHPCCLLLARCVLLLRTAVAASVAAATAWVRSGGSSSEAAAVSNGWANIPEGHCRAAKKTGLRPLSYYLPLHRAPPVDPLFTCFAAPFEPSEASLSNFNWPPPELDEEPTSAPVARCSSDRLSEAVRPAAGRRSRRCFFVAAAAVMR